MIPALNLNLTPSDHIVFSASIREEQRRRGGVPAHERIAARGGFRTALTPDLVAFLADVDTAYLATASASGQPYAQHRGGPKGFIRALDDHTLGFADFAGNRQYITAGNLAENERAFLFLMDYAHQRRIKLWGRARMVDEAALIARLMPEHYKARPERALLFTVDAWDSNCRQHIPQKFDAADVAEAVQRLEQRVADLERENASLRAALAPCMA
jgi:predicted pyridoxine 5'-phosphate oxidase superfamily flavin-nucleotide-binding protein